jgi:hypothetical protein
MAEQEKGSAKPAPKSEEDKLWNAHISETHFDGSRDKYTTAVLEQYKLYVGTTDHISDRRMQANNFFLTLHTAVAAGIGFLIATNSKPFTLIFAIIAATTALLMCGVWVLLLMSYRNLNTAKFIVVGKLEERLPASPLWKAEWAALGQGKNRRKYWPLSHLELLVPTIVALLYVGIITLCVFLYVNRDSTPSGSPTTQPSTQPTTHATI